MTTTQKLDTFVRWLLPIDYDAVIDIERRCFGRTIGAKYLASWLNVRNVTGMVCEDRGHVRGFMVYEMFNKRLEVLDFAVHPNWQRMGVGATMVAKLIRLLGSENHPRDEIALWVPETRLSAQLFFREMGFTAEIVERGRFGDRDGFRFIYMKDVPWPNP